MFKDIYHRTASIKDFWVEYPGVLNARQADLVASFPSTHTAFVKDYFQILRNFVDHYQLEYQDALSFKYWFNCVVFLPQKVLSYLGLNSDGPLGKISNIIYWTLSFIWTVFEARLIELIKQILHLK